MLITESAGGAGGFRFEARLLGTVDFVVLLPNCRGGYTAPAQQSFTLPRGKGQETGDKGASATRPVIP